MVHMNQKGLLHRTGGADGGGVSEKYQKSVMYYLNGPLVPIILKLRFNISVQFCSALLEKSYNTGA
jgi:hypothetical protein